MNNITDSLSTGDIIITETNEKFIISFSKKENKFFLLDITTGMIIGEYEKTIISLLKSINASFKIYSRNKYKLILKNNNQLEDIKKWLSNS